MKKESGVWLWAPVVAFLSSCVFLAYGAMQVHDYRRADWPHWSGSCPDTRQRVLIEESRVPPTLTPNGCRVVAGEWMSYYDGELVTVPGALDVDHMVPLANAHRSGAAPWDRDRKRAYANELEAAEHLVAVTARSNRQKSDQGPDTWRPPRTASWCRYAGEWMLVKLRWGLTATDAELVALREMVAACPR